MNVRRGEVVLARFPFLVGSGGKARPALVVSADRENLRLPHAVFLPITSNTSRRREPTHVFIDPATEDGSQSGLLFPSCVVGTLAMALAASVVVKRLGFLSPAAMSQVDDALRATFDLA